MGDVVAIFVRVIIIVLFASIPVWIATRRARRKYRERFGRTPTNLELDSLGAWLKEPTDAPTSQPSAQSPPTEPSSETSFGREPRA
ncbi:MAG: hypothetical protein QOJ70_3115 [Acidobacteriota bacterium]|jgi:hypothetical protein|nr:hypothetical protein [Acidobacteriota bacterium]